MRVASSSRHSILLAGKQESVHTKQGWLDSVCAAWTWHRRYNGHGSPMKIPEIEAIAKAHSVSAAQVILSWQFSLNITVNPVRARAFTLGFRPSCNTVVIGAWLLRLPVTVTMQGFVGPGLPGYEPPDIVAKYMKENLASVQLTLTDAEVRRISALPPLAPMLAP